jgi:hypothetical protein
MKKWNILLVSVIVLICSFLWYVNYEFSLIRDGPSVCINGQIMGYECGPVSGMRVCYDPMNDTGKECSGDADCYGSCMVNVNISCRNIDFEYANMKAVAICGPETVGVCSQERKSNAGESLYSLSEIPSRYLGALEGNYSMQKDDKIIADFVMFCA